MPPHKKTKTALPSRTQAAANTRKPLTKAELVGLADLMRAKFESPHRARQYQMDGIEAQLQMRDVLVHAGTGMGKTTIAAGPHAHPTSAGKVTLMISPLIALHDEQVETFREEFKLKATAVNSSNGGCTIEVLQEIVRGDHQIVLISPEMVLSRRFIREVLRNAEFGRRILSVVVDEAHVVSHWGASFRKKYGTLGMIRAFLPRGTPVVALSATLPARIRNDVLSKLQFGQDYANVDVGNDRPNVSIIVRGIHYPLNTYADLDFIVAGIRTKEDIKKTFIYADNIATGVEIIDHLISLLPPELRDVVQGYDPPFRPYNAALSKEYRRKAMKLFKAGTIRILVCTDAAGMGCNIPDIDVVVQWKLPASISLFVQRAGRAARASGRTGLAILLVEPSAYGIDLAEGITTKTSGGKGKKKVEKEKETSAEKREKAKKKKDYAKLRGVQRGGGGAGGKHDAIFVVETPALDPEAQDEGLLVFVQTMKCRRAVLTEIYNNKLAQPTAPCCDICSPELLDKTRPGKPPAVARQSATKRGEVNTDVQTTLHQWRVKIKARDYPTPLYTASAIMRDDTIALLSSVGPIDSRESLQTILAGQWTWWGEYGEELYSCLAALTIPPMVPLPPKRRGKKRVLEGVVEEEDNVPSKRQHVQTPPIAAGTDVTASAPVASGSGARKARAKKPAMSKEEVERLNREAFLAADIENLARATALAHSSTSNVFDDPLLRYTPILTLVTNVYCTSFIGWKIWTITRLSLPSGGTKLRHFLVIVVESAALYALWAVLFLVAFETKSNLQVVLIQAGPELIGLVNALIMTRVGLGWTSEQIHGTPYPSALVFAASGDSTGR
ncbi:P-loop containing nucleoside triphosphate hydrolase protein [Mycena metata]|uniref:DNA 3'-5' helicase n=1 Tax=Mycena metata TaxID=1033252 RepID=A0AAD7JRD5_9AGAR|nr:P-loop containing nucleoside triphosphate hydrolase protein [Mycena metata]